MPGVLSFNVQYCNRNVTLCRMQCYVVQSEIAFSPALGLVHPTVARVRLKLSFRAYMLTSAAVCTIGGHKTSHPLARAGPYARSTRSVRGATTDAPGMAHARNLYALSNHPASEHLL